MPDLIFDSVRRHYPGALRPALDNVSLRIPAGATALLMGPSGSGKTTLLNLAAALDRPDAGRIRVGGLDLTTLSEGRRSRYRAKTVGTVFQGHFLPPGTTVLEAVASPLLWSRGLSPRVAERSATELLGRVGLKDLLDTRVQTLSGGQRQRVALARALAPEPPLLLADEPTAQLDPENRAQVRALLRDWTAEHGNTLVVVSHDLVASDENWGESLRVVLRDGRIVEEQASLATSANPMEDSQEP